MSDENTPGEDTAAEETVESHLAAIEEHVAAIRELQEKEPDAPADE